MTKRSRLWLIAGISIAGLAGVLVVGGIAVLQSNWFANFVRQKIISTLNDSTGGSAELGSFELDWPHRTVRIRNFVLHGTEVKGADPLARIQLMELRLELFSALKKPVALESLRIQQPQVNVMVNADGTTNIPEPKVKKPPSQTSPLQTVVDLAVNEFEIQDGVLEFAQRKTAFQAKGENLRALLNYDTAVPSYHGSLSIDPLLLASGRRPPLAVRVNLPITIERDAIRLRNASLLTGQSQIFIDASAEKMNAPLVAAQVNAKISLQEVQHSAGLAENTLRGDLLLNASAKLDAQQNYLLDGTINSNGLALRSGTTQIPDIRLYAPFHADPHLVRLDGVKLNALGGELAARILLTNMQQLRVESTLRNFSLAVLSTALAGKPLGYDGMINGSLHANGDLQSKGTSGYTAQARLAINPGHRGVPVSGQLNADYMGSTGAVNLEQSYIVAPNTRIDLSGSLNQQINVNLVSYNLNDFLPAANFGAAKPQSALPVTLDGGRLEVATKITGDLSQPHITSHIAIDRFAVEQKTFDHAALDLAASPFAARVTNGVLTRQALQTKFDASLGLSKWKPLARSALTANLEMRNGDLADLLALAGQKTIRASGQVSADAHIGGTYGDPQGNARLQVVNGVAYEQPFDRIYADVSLADVSLADVSLADASTADQAVSLNALELDTLGGRIQATGVFRHPHDSFTSGQAQLHLAASNLQLATVRALENRSPGAAGLIQLNGDAAAEISQRNGQTQVAISTVGGKLSASGLRVENRSAGGLLATAQTSNGAVHYEITSDFAKSRIRVTGHTALAKDYPTTADASIRNLAIEQLLQITGQTTIPVCGELSADAHVAGTLQSPDGNLSFALRRATVYQEPLSDLQGSVHYNNTMLDIPSIRLAIPAGAVMLNGSFRHPANNFDVGEVRLNVDSGDVQAAKIQYVQQQRLGIAGTLRLGLHLSATLEERGGQREMLLKEINADALAQSLQIYGRGLGNASFVARTSPGARAGARGSNGVDFHFDSDLAQSQVHASGQAQLAGDYPAHARLTFSNIRYANLAPFISEEPGIAPGFDALVEGQASVDGPLLKTDALVGRLQFDRLEAKTNPQGSPTGAPPGRILSLANDGPIVLALEHSLVQVQRLQITGPKTLLSVSGAVSLKNAREPVRLTVKANADLSALHDADRDFQSSGAVAIDAIVHGDFSQPLVNGQVELKNASVNYSDAPNGLSNGNGVILLNGQTATIQSLTGESGGGKISLTGFAGYNSRAIAYNLHATATKVRTRYSGISVTADAAISLTGNNRRSRLTGTLTVQRIAYSSSSDAGSILYAASEPPATPKSPSPLLTGMRMDIRIVTAPDLRVVTTYAERLDIFANLTVRGTAAMPGILGRVNVTSGQLVFFGNKYTVNTGTINFYDPNAILPVVDLSLETVTQGVDVVIGVTGPANDLQLSYRSDPPLTFEQIVQLLATNTTPSDPTIAAHQPTPPQQSLSQMGASAVLGQAVANPVASRVQRVFGLTQFKIDPSISGSNGQPSARVTLQQKIANNITFTYITDVTQTNSEIVRVEWDLTRRFSAVALRDFNGNVSLEFFYKFKVR